MDLEDLPDLLLTDITLPETNGFDAIAKIMQRDPLAKILVCSVVGDASMVIDSLKSEASGCINKVNILNGFS